MNRSGLDAIMLAMATAGVLNAAFWFFLFGCPTVSSRHSASARRHAPGSWKRRPTKRIERPAPSAALRVPPLIRRTVRPLRTSMADSTDKELQQALAEFVGAFEVVFRYDWPYTKIMVGDEAEGAHASSSSQDSMMRPMIGVRVARCWRSIGGSFQ